MRVASCGGYVNECIVYSIAWRLVALWFVYYHGIRSMYS